jgi:signal transduction histidine kinase
MLNPENDSLALLLARMKHEASGLLKEIPHQFEASEIGTDRKVDLVVKRNIFLSYKEALNNVARHSGATRVLIRVRCADDSLTVEIEDNGHGFNASTTVRGNGLQNMRIRAENIGGKCDIISAPNSGTMVRLTAKIA